MASARRFRYKWPHADKETMTKKGVFVGTVAVALVVVGGWVSWWGWQAYRTVQHLPEAYAAWDTGTLLVAYMERHEDRWPASWDALLGMLDSQGGRAIPLRGSHAGDLLYARSLRNKVAVDWNFDPARPGAGLPVTPVAGGDFSVVWQGANPNDMVRQYLEERASTRPTPTTGAAPRR